MAGKFEPDSPRRYNDAVWVTDMVCIRRIGGFMASREVGGGTWRRERRLRHSLHADGGVCRHKR